MTVKIIFKRHPWATPSFVLMSDCPSVDHAISAFKQSCPGLELVRAFIDQPIVIPNSTNSLAEMMRRHFGEE